MTIMRLIDRKNISAVDHYSGKKLNEFSLSENEFCILADLETYYSSYKKWTGIGVEKFRPEDTFASKTNLLNYIRGLKSALDIVIETEDGFKLQLKWQSSLY